MSTSKFNKITKKEIASAGVRSLPDRPNAYSKYGAGALTASQLKEAFDKLAVLISERLNVVFGELEEGDFSKYIHPPAPLAAEGVESLSELLERILNGKFADILRVDGGVRSLSQKFNQNELDKGKICSDIKAVSNGVNDVRTDMENHVADLNKALADNVSELVKSDQDITAYINALVGSINGRTVDQLSYDALTGTLTITSTDETLHEIDLPLELTVDGGYYDGEERCIVIELTSGDEVRIPVDDLDAEAFESRLEEISRASATKAGLKDAVVVNGEVRYPSEGLEYEKDEYGLTYTVVGLGTCTDKNIVVPRMYNGFPVAAVGDDAFVSERVDSINLFEGVQNIGARAFAGCTALRFVYIYSTVPISVGESAFPDTVQGYFVPLHNVEDYKANEGWERYADKTVAIETFESVNTTIVNFYNVLFSYIVNLINNDAALQQGVANLSQLIQNLANNQNVFTQVDANLQSQINELTPYSEGLEYKVVNVDGVTGLGVLGKGTCTDKDIVIPPTYAGHPVLSIEAGAFECDRSGITSVTIPESVVSIGSGAFDMMTDDGIANYTCQNVTCLAKTPPKAIVRNMWLFYHCHYVHVPRASIEAYKAAEGWNTRVGTIRHIETPETLRADIDAIDAKLASLIDVSEVGA